MTDRKKVIADIEEQIAWIRENDFHKFHGWGHVVLAMKDALELLKEQEAQRDYEASVEMAEYCERYEQTYNPEDGSM